MKTLTIICAIALGLSGGAVLAQAGGSNIRVQAGYFCAQNKCVRFSGDLQDVSIQGRQAVSVSDYNLQSNPVISSDTYREIFSLALRQRGVGSRG